MASNIKSRVIKEITVGTERDRQRRAGPSNISNTCPKCVGQSLAGVADDRDFSLYPWLGTAVHEYLENNCFQGGDAHRELKLVCGEVPKYGTIKGTTDLLLFDPVTQTWTVVDYKIVGLKKIKSYIVNGPPENYRYQTQIYGTGCVVAGFEVANVAICFIPRDSGNVNDIYIYEEAYQPEMAEAAFARAGLIYEIVENEGWETLPESPDCYQCNASW